MNIEKINRSQINKAAYNPRKITDERRAKLAESVERYGMVIPYVWNKRTGNLVGGHQRLDLQDESEGRPEYELQVSVVDLSEEDEKALNVLLNSSQIGGEFDDDLLQKLLDDLGGKLDFDLNALIAGEEKKGSAKLKKLNAQKPPKLAWALVGIPVGRYPEIAAQIEMIAAVPDTIVETTFN